MFYEKMTIIVKFPHQQNGYQKKNNKHGRSDVNMPTVKHKNSDHDVIQWYMDYFAVPNSGRTYAHSNKDINF